MKERTVIKLWLVNEQSTFLIIAHTHHIYGVRAAQSTYIHFCCWLVISRVIAMPKHGLPNNFKRLVGSLKMILGQRWGVMYVYCIFYKCDHGSCSVRTWSCARCVGKYILAGLTHSLINTTMLLSLRAALFRALNIHHSTSNTKRVILLLFTAEGSDAVVNSKAPLSEGC